ncbi:MAG: trigger factor [Blastocatellia bacterium]
MKTEIKEISQTMRELHLEIPPSALKAAYDEVSRRYSVKANIPGFRKGVPAPLEIVRLRFKDEIRNDVLQMVVSNAAARAMDEAGVQPVGDPQIHIDNFENISVDGSEPLKVHIHFEVMPEIPEPDYAAIEVERRVKPIEESDVDEYVAQLLERESALVPIEDRSASDGDTLIVDLEGRFDGGESEEPVIAKDLEIKLGDANIDPTFTSNLVGVKADDVREFTVSYPDDYAAEQLRGRTVHYKATVRYVGRAELPKADDDWAKSLDLGVETYCDLRKKLRADLEAYAKSSADARLRNDAMEKMIEHHRFEVPRLLVENQTRVLLNEFVQDLRQKGADLSKLDEGFLGSLYGQLMQRAEREVRGALLLGKIAEIENISIKPEEIEAEIADLATYHRVTPEEVKKSLGSQEGLRQIEHNLKTRKAIEAIVGKIKVSEGKWVEQTEQEAKACRPESAQSASEPSDEAKEKKAARQKRTTKKNSQPKASAKAKSADD